MKTIIIIQVLVAFIIGVSALFLLYKLMDSFLRKRFQIEENNTSFAIFQSGILLSGSLIFASVVNPAVNAIRFINQDVFEWQSVAISFGFVSMFVAIGICCTLMVIAGGIFTFFQLTNVNEFEQIKANNIATAIITVAFILGLSIIMDEYVGHLCEALIPYPSVLEIR